MADNQLVEHVDSKAWVNHFMKQAKYSTQIRAVNIRNLKNQRVIVVENSTIADKNKEPIRISTISPEESVIEQAKSHIKKYGDEEPKPILNTEREDTKGIKEMTTPKSSIAKKRAEEATTLLHRSIRKKAAQDIFQ